MCSPSYWHKNMSHCLLPLGYPNSLTPENCRLGYCASGRDNSLPTFRENLSGDWFTENSVGNCHYSLRNNPDEDISHLLRGGSLKSAWRHFTRQEQFYGEIIVRSLTAIQGRYFLGLKAVADIFCLILTKFGVSRRNSIVSPNIKCHGYPPTVKRADTDERASWT
jgi:hypothetical protein